MARLTGNRVPGAPRVRRSWQFIVYEHDGCEKTRSLPFSSLKDVDARRARLATQLGAGYTVEIQQCLPL